MAFFTWVREKWNSKEAQPTEVLESYLRGDARIEQLWTTFDADRSGNIESDELDEIIHVALNVFAKIRTPNSAELDRETTEPFIQKVRGEIQAQVDKDENNKIDRKEFDSLGAYLRNEYKCVLREVEEDNLLKN